MNQRIAAGTECVACRKQGHGCPAYDLSDEGEVPLCIACLDGVPCRFAPKTAIPSSAKASTPPPASRPVTVCSRGCGKPTHRGQCGGQREKPALTPAPAKQEVQPGAPLRRVISRSEVPSRPGMHPYDDVFRSIASLSAEQSLELTFAGYGEAERFAKRISKHLSKRRMPVSYKRVEAKLYFWQREAVTA